MRKILIGIPYHPSKRYALDHIMDWLEHQEQPNVDVIMSCDMYGGPNAIKEQMERLRAYAVDNGYDYLYIMEADTIPPLDVLPKLIACETDVIGALYYYRDTGKNAVAWRKNNPHKTFLDAKASLVEVDGMGTGAVLLSAKALRAFSFLEWDIPDADYPMYDRLRDRGFNIWLHKGLVCKHYADAVRYY